MNMKGNLTNWEFPFLPLEACAKKANKKKVHHLWGVQNIQKREGPPLGEKPAGGTIKNR